MELRTAAPEDLGKIMELIDQAKAFLKRNGVDQWQNGYPDQTCIEEDIRKGKGYLCILDHDIAGYVCIDFEGEDVYKRQVLTARNFSITFSVGTSSA